MAEQKDYNPYKPLLGGNPDSSLPQGTQILLDEFTQDIRRLDELVLWAKEQLAQPDNKLTNEEIEKLKEIIQKEDEISECKRNINQKLF